jgi:hypothetical protein
MIDPTISAVAVPTPSVPRGSCSTEVAAGPLGGADVLLIGIP